MGYPYLSSPVNLKPIFLLLALCLTATELSDENTALSRKLAHLETQLAVLQQRYTELETRQGRRARDGHAAARTARAMAPVSPDHRLARCRDCTGRLAAAPQSPPTFHFLG